MRCACAETLAARKVALIEQKIADLAAMRKVLARLVKQCDQGDGGAACPIIDVLATD
jgi:MerR family transcriptional regulator, mercuric resistance operon regulatory protein